MGKRHTKIVPRDFVQAPNKQEHKDVLMRNVLSCMNGKWTKYENMLKAKTILLPENHHNIYINPEHMKEACPYEDYSHFMRSFGLETMQEVWEHIWNIAQDPYNTVRRYEELDANPNFKPLKKRSKRQLAYKFVFDPNNESMMSNYWGLPPQARTIIDIFEDRTKAILETNPGKAVIFQETEMQQIMEEEKERLETKQTSWRIFQYYRGKLIQYNFLRYSR